MLNKAQEHTSNELLNMNTKACITDLYPLLAPFMEAASKSHQLCQHMRKKYAQHIGKPSAECVTLADYGVQVIINRLLHTISPESSVVAEESSADFFQITSAAQQDMIVSITSEILGQKLSVQEFANYLDYGQEKKDTEKVWVIDPIDGTLEFLASNRYVIGIGSLVNSIPDFSFLSQFSPEKNSEIHYFTWSGRSYSYDPVNESLSVLQVSDRTVHCARPYCNEPVMSQIYGLDFIEGDVYSTLSAYISIAAGESDVLISRGFANTSEKVWDHVGGIALLQNASGVLSDLDGSKLDFSQGRILRNNKGVILSNGKFHGELLTKS